ncbi:MAG: DUF1700 domain-containing protein [Lachnospiraceae bacterium]|nr:DUF1700 domain-containing protein [Lachnospiraceae bacterium]
MSKIEFLERLEKLLADVPYTERREALNYYTEYFEDAEKDEEEVIKTLGSPEEVAHNIREELAGKELATTDVVYESSESARETDDNIIDVETKEKKSKLEGWQIALIVLVAIVTLPLWGGVATAILGAILSVIAACIGIILGLALVGVAFFVVAMVLLGVGFANLISSPVASFFAMGLSIFLVGVSMLCLIASWKVLTVLIPAIWKGLVYIFQSIFGRKECATA